MSYLKKDILQISQDIILPDIQNVVNTNGKHTVCGEQHELIIHTDVLDPQSSVRLSHGRNNEQRIPGAQ